MNRRIVLPLLMIALAPVALQAQSTGGIDGRVVDAATNRPIRGAEIRVDGGRWTTITDTTGEYRLRSISAGVHRLDITLPGYRPSHRDGIEVHAGEILRVDARLAPVAVQLQDLSAVGIQDPVLDPLATASAQRVTAEDLRRMPITTLEDAIALQAGVVGESFRGGRVGQQAFVLDGFGLKNQLDGSQGGGAGIRIPPDIITEAALITNGFSARYGQAISGLINVTTRDGGDRWHGRLAYETDRPMTGAADLGIDRGVLEADGPLFGKLTAVAILDLNGTLDGDAANAPTPADPRDPRHLFPRPLPHNSGETWTGGLKLTMPLGERVVARAFGLGTTEQRYLFDPAYKYDPDYAPGRRVDGRLLTGHLQLLPAPKARHPVYGDLRIGTFSREFMRGAVEAPDYAFGGFTGRRLQIRGEELAKRQDTAGVRASVAGFDPPQYSDRTPWGVPAFFLSDAPQGEIAWNRFREVRAQLDMNAGISDRIDLTFGGLYAAQDVRTFQRVLAWLPVGGDVPPATASAFSPSLGGVYVEGQARSNELALTAGVRYDMFNPGGKLPNRTLGARSSLNPRIAVATVLKGATLVASLGRFSQPPDLEYLVDAAFDDSTRTGRFRQGNPNLGFESSTQFELSARVRLREATSLKLNVFDKRLNGLVASTPINVNPDSSVFVNADQGEVIGAELIFERERKDNWSARISGVLQRAQATVTDAFQLQRLVVVDPVTHDTIAAGRNQFPLDYDRRIALIAFVEGALNPQAGPRFLGGHPFGGLSLGLVGRYSSGLPFTRTNATGDSLIGPINGDRLPSQSMFDLLLRKPLMIGGAHGGLYLDIRNLLNRRNLISVRRDTGRPEASDQTITTLANAAYAANPYAIPYESSRYRPWADTNKDGVIAGREELFPLYQAAARDYTTPLFVYGPPRTIRFGVEFVF